MLIEIKNDVYNISKRIKKIDKDYIVFYNTSKNKFEIHNLGQIGGSYCLTLPFDSLDERTIKHVRKTSSANIDEILEKIENENKVLESTEKISALSNVAEKIENI